MTLRLVLGNQRYSSWSLRPWLCLELSGLPFETIVVRFDDPSFKEKVPAPSGKVPVLIDGDTVVHESLAICEHVAERAPGAGLWPRGLQEKARARALSSEMHAGFAALRTECPMDVCRAEPAGRWPISAATRADVARIDAIFRAAGAGDGPFLFGPFGVVDAMFAPVATRILSYGLEVSPEARRYVDAIVAMPAMQRWYAAGERERSEGWGHYSGTSKAPRDHEDAMHYALEWADHWNRRDAEAVLAHFADDCEFRSPRARETTGSDVVRGKAALRAYWQRALERLPAEQRFEIDRVDLAPDTSTLVIHNLRRDHGRVSRACEVLTFDPRTGLVVRGEAYYGA